MWSEILVETTHQADNSFDSKGLYQSQEIFSFDAEYLGRRGAIASSRFKRL
jgi:hypothetical protein